MDTTLYPTDADLLHALVPLVPAVTIQATLDELGLGSVPHNRLLEDALVSIIQAVPALRTRLLGQVHVTLDQAAAMLRITPSTLKHLVQTEIIPVSSSGTLLRSARSSSLQNFSNVGPSSDSIWQRCPKLPQQR